MIASIALDAAATSTTGSPWMSIILFGGFFAVMWFIMIRPQKKQQKLRQQMLDELKVGDIVTTIGRFYGTVTKIKDDIVTIKIGPNGTELMIERRGIDSVNEQVDAESLL